MHMDASRDRKQDGDQLMSREKRPFIGLREKTILIVLVIVVVTMVGFSVYFYGYSCDRATERYHEQTAILRDNLVGTIDYYVTNCAKSARSIYYNDSVMKLLTGKNGNFINGETRDSNEVFSYLLSTYASVPSAVQVQLSAYRLERSFLLTTYDLVHYMRVAPGLSYEQEYPQSPRLAIAGSVRVLNSHPLTNYGHFITNSASRNQYVFTVQIPLYILPDETSLVGLLSVDISTKYIESICSFGNDSMTEVYIVAKDGSVIYAPDEERIGETLDEPWNRQETAGPSGGYTCSGMEVSVRDFSSPYYQWRIYVVTPTKEVLRDAFISQMALMTSFLLALLLIAAALFSVMLQIVSPLKRMTMFFDSNRSLEKYNLKARLQDVIHYSANDEIGILIQTIDAMLDTIEQHIEREYKMQLATRNSELRALQAQINPHFIYNTLQYIGSRVLENGDAESYNAIASFGKMLHYAMNMDESTASIEQEVDYVRRYLELQAMRNDHGLEFEVKYAPGVRELMIPKMTLQPMAENAVIHGRLFNKPDSRILIKLEIENGDFCLTFVNNGERADADKIRIQMERARDFRKKYAQIRRETGSFSQLLQNVQMDEDGRGEDGSSHHIGLGNVYVRFLLQYDGQCELNMRINERRETEVSLRVPLMCMHVNNQGGALLENFDC